MIVRELGRLGYVAALEVQEAARERVLAGGDDELLLLEHDPVVTLGRRGGIVDREALARLDTPVLETRRGGLATWHGPGQLVGYPIVALERAHVDVTAFVRRLGALMLAISERFGVADAAYDDARPGIYREGRKLGSIGLHIHKGVTMHGFALNVDIDLAGFQAIVPCGFAGLHVSSLAREVGRPAALADAVAVARELGPSVLLG
ncbi:MAG: lipoyl(octanoyl) transferase LipB [Deltaproteobacteria bacterium]|nr:MAG: lipoyl(octanoyl) transferase LipB [Deltaproteobacteria bacterium]